MPSLWVFRRWRVGHRISGCSAADIETPAAVASHLRSANSPKPEVANPKPGALRPASIITNTNSGVPYISIVSGAPKPYSNC